jgi:hypothetical protein
MGKAVLPVDAPVQKPLPPGDIAVSSPTPGKSPLENQGDPFADGPAPQPEFTEQPFRPKNETAPAPEAVRQTGPDSAGLEDTRTRLAAVDQEFQAMIEEDPSAWNLTSLEQQYQQLDQMSDLPAFQTKINQRLKAVERYAKIKQEYEEFVRVTTETKQRDAQLLSLTTQPGGELSSNSGPTTPAPPTPSANPPARTAPALPKSFDGAGIIQRAATNFRSGPQFVLVAPGGRVLAYLQPAPGVDLNAYVGQAMGVIGQRSYRQELQGELIVVRSLTPVRLKAAP